MLRFQAELGVFCFFRPRNQSSCAGPWLDRLENKPCPTAWSLQSHWLTTCCRFSSSWIIEANLKCSPSLLEAWRNHSELKIRNHRHGAVALPWVWLKMRLVGRLSWMDLPGKNSFNVLIALMRLEMSEDLGPCCRNPFITHQRYWWVVLSREAFRQLLRGWCDAPWSPVAAHMWTENWGNWVQWKWRAQCSPWALPLVSSHVCNISMSTMLKYSSSAGESGPAPSWSLWGTSIAKWRMRLGNWCGLKLVQSSHLQPLSFQELLCVWEMGCLFGLWWRKQRWKMWV